MLYSDDELNQIPELTFEDALRDPAKGIKLRIYQHEQAAALVGVAEMTNLQSLSVSLSNVDFLLPGLARLTDLQILDLQACKLSEFPTGILGLAHLKKLTIGNCSLKNIPEQIGNLLNLEELHLDQNALARIPDSIGQLSRLKRLGLSYNQLISLPGSIGNLRELYGLWLGVNQLTEIPKTLENLKDLRYLALNHNKLRHLPEGICALESLEYLSLEQNPWDTLPVCLAGMKWIKDFSIEASKRQLFMDWQYQPCGHSPVVELADLGLFLRKDSPLYQSLSADLQEEGLGPFSTAILQHTRFSVQMETTVPDDYTKSGSSRFGGFPDLPDPSHFPKTDGLHWSFLAQINLADFAHLKTCLPPAGLLSFFIDSTQSFNGKVLFYPDPRPSLVTVRHQGGDSMVDGGDDYTDRPHKLKFSASASVPPDPPPEIQNEGKKMPILNSKWEPVKLGIK